MFLFHSPNIFPLNHTLPKNKKFTLGWWGCKIKVRFFTKAHPPHNQNSSIYFCCLLLFDLSFVVRYFSDTKV